MKKKRDPQKVSIENLNPDIQNHDDSLKPVNESNDGQPEIYGISRRGKSINRKNFVKSAASAAGLAALGSLLTNCEGSDLDIVVNGENCTCHAVCTCNSQVDGDNKYDKGNSYKSIYDGTNYCTCDTVCTCNSVCTCDSVCSCNSEGGGGGGSYTYWYPC